MPATLDRRRLLKLSATGALSLALPGCIAPQRSSAIRAVCRSAGRAEKRPNVLILLTDDQRFDTINALGNPAIKTANMDRLVRRGVAFANTYIMGSCHGAVCMPSRAMLLTGRHYFNLPDSVKTLWAVPPEERGHCPYITLPELLRQAGYVTFATGKWHNGRRLFAKGFTCGESIFFGGMSDHRKVPVFAFDPTGEYPASRKYLGEKFSSTLFSEAAVRFLESYDGDDPFLMYVSYTAPHDPRMAPDKYGAMYRPEKISLPPNFMPEHPFSMGDLRIRDERLAPFPRTPEVVREHIAEYYAMITHLDTEIGRVLDALQESGHAENTIVILSSDNGLAVGQHGLLGKQNIYEHSVRVPLIISGPGIPAGQKCDALCYLHDVLPTICELAGLAIPESVQTRSLLPLLSGKRSRIRDSIFLSYSTGPLRPVRGGKLPGMLRGVRAGPWKLILCHYEGTVTTRLFDLENDPWETENLAGDAALGDRVRELTKLLEEWVDKSGDRVRLDQPDWGVRSAPQRPPPDRSIQ